jgi:transcriptional regulator with XRE-family HTH domain
MPTISPKDLNIGRNVNAHRKRLGLSLDQLSRACGVSKAMLSQIEQQKANPTVAVLMKIAMAMNLQLTDVVDAAPAADILQVISRDDPKALYRSTGGVTVRTLSPLSLEKDIEFYQVTIDAGKAMESEPHFKGTEEFLTVHGGHVELTVAGRQLLMRAGDSAHYRSDVLHRIASTGRGRAVCYLVVKYRE